MARTRPAMQARPQPSTLIWRTRKERRWWCARRQRREPGGMTGPFKAPLRIRRVVATGRPGGGREPKNKAGTLLAPGSIASLATMSCPQTCRFWKKTLNLWTPIPPGAEGHCMCARSLGREGRELPSPTGDSDASRGARQRLVVGIKKITEVKIDLREEI